MEGAPLVEPAAVAVHAVRRGGAAEGSIAVVLGAGPIGVLVVQAATALGAGHVVVVDPSAARRERALGFGADVAFAPGPEADAHVAERSGGLGADVVYECAGVAETVQASVDAARRGGTVVLAGVAETPATIVPALWVVKEVTVIGALAYERDDFERTIDLAVRGKLDLGGMRERTVTLGDLAATFSAMAAGEVDDLKVVVDPTLAY
jgi:(R,R)-butanediol dehydrogenase/meso-butanediol dehydrogenase/diacetyl reductase